MKSLIAIIVGFGSLFLAGCNDSLLSQVRQVSARLGVPIVLKAAENDACVADQFFVWEEEWRHMSSTRKAQVKAAARAHKTVTIGPARPSRWETGEEITFYFSVSSCDSGDYSGYYENGGCRTVFSKEKEFKKTFFVKGGPARNAVFRKDGAVTLQPHAYDRDIPIHQYYAKTIELFTKVDSMSDPDFKKGLAEGTITHGELTGLRQKGICGAALPLRAFVSADFEVAYRVELKRLLGLWPKYDHSITYLDKATPEENFVYGHFPWSDELVDEYKRLGYPAFNVARVEKEMEYWHGRGINEPTIRMLAEAIVESRE